MSSSCISTANKTFESFSEFRIEYRVDDRVHEGIHVPDPGRKEKWIKSDLAARLVNEDAHSIEDVDCEERDPTD